MAQFCLQLPCWSLVPVWHLLSHPCSKLGWAPHRLELHEQAAVPVVQWQPGGEMGYGQQRMVEADGSQLLFTANSGVSAVASGGVRVLERAPMMEGPWWAISLFLGVPSHRQQLLFGHIPPTTCCNKYRPCRENSACVRGKNELKRRRKWQHNLKRSLEQQKNMEAMRWRENGNEQESQPADGSSKAMDMPGRQDGWRTRTCRARYHLCFMQR